MLTLFLAASTARTLDIDAYGAVRGSSSPEAIASNVLALNRAIADAQPGDSVRVSKGAGAYTMIGPIAASNLSNVSINFEGEVALDDTIAAWPSSARKVWLTLSNSSHVTISGGGVINGHGMKWWDASITGSTPGIGENRPNLFNIDDSTDVLIERLNLHSELILLAPQSFSLPLSLSPSLPLSLSPSLLLHPLTRTRVAFKPTLLPPADSPHFHIKFKQCARVTIRYVNISVDRWAQRAIKAKAHAQRLVRTGLLNGSIAQSVANRLYTSYGPSVGAEIGATALPDWLLDWLVKLLPPWALQPEDLNTDGIDPNGEDFYVHDCNVSNDDDSIAVKPSTAAEPIPCSRNMRFENLILTGFGASIGSVPPHADVNCVRNITFKNISMPGTGKGIYVKSNPTCGVERDRHGKLTAKTSLIEGITFEDVAITRPFWWAIWIGPQQQHEPGSDLGRKCALVYPIDSSCPTQGCATFGNITLRNVLIDDPLLSPGVILGNASNPMRELAFEDVQVRFSEKSLLRGTFPWGREYKCEHAQTISTGGTTPAPQCG
jgi:hypothetical protein